jgi:hypothetical protein
MNARRIRSNRNAFNKEVPDSMHSLLVLDGNGQYLPEQETGGKRDSTIVKGACQVLEPRAEGKTQRIRSGQGKAMNIVRRTRQWGCKDLQTLPAITIRQGSEYINRVAWLRSNGVIRIHISSTDYPHLVDYKTGRHRQCPGLISVKFHEVDAKRKVDFAQILGKLENQMKLTCYKIARIAQKVQSQRLLSGELPVELVKLRRDCHKRRAKRGNVRKGLLKSYQLQIAVGSPLSAVET